MHIGIDFDNTLVRYDRAFRTVAVEWRLVDPSFPASKPAVRAELRSRPGGERVWTRLQGEVYARRMDLAEVAPGAERLLRECRLRGIPVSVVSHKTVFPVIGPRVDLREAALAWIEHSGLFSPVGLSRDRVWFEETREAKIERIARIGCTHFVDDLVEVYLEPSFPRGVVRILCGDDAAVPGVEQAADLGAVCDRLLRVPA